MSAISKTVLEMGMKNHFQGKRVLQLLFRIQFPEVGANFYSERKPMLYANKVPNVKQHTILLLKQVQTMP